MAMPSLKDIQLAAFLAYNRERLILRALTHFNIEHKRGCDAHPDSEVDPSEVECGCGRDALLEIAMGEVDKEPEIRKHFSPAEAAHFLTAHSKKERT
jgi:hypothetical protein